MLGGLVDQQEDAGDGSKAIVAEAAAALEQLGFRVPVRALYLSLDAMLGYIEAADEVAYAPREVHDLAVEALVSDFGALAAAAAGGSWLPDGHLVPLELQHADSVTQRLAVATKIATLNGSAEDGARGTALMEELIEAAVSAGPHAVAVVVEAGLLQKGAGFIAAAGDRVGSGMWTGLDDGDGPLPHGTTADAGWLYSEAAAIWSMAADAVCTDMARQP
jgi:hypothetical protein